MQWVTSYLKPERQLRFSIGMLQFAKEANLMRWKGQDPIKTTR